MSLLEKFAGVERRFRALRSLGRDPSSMMFDEVISPTMGVLEGREVLLFGTNNYLGMTFDEACVEAAVAATRAHGVGTTGSRAANGTYGAHKALEARVARFYGRAEAIVFSTGYTANLGTICGVAGQGDQILIDADSHASIYDACRMSGAEIIRFRHNSAADLEKRLRRLEGRPGLKLVVTEGIFSMLGDSAPLKDIAAVKRAAGENVHLLVDEAHSLGVLGETGRGKCEADGVEADVDFVVGTFSKSIGCVGGFCTSDMPGFEALRVLSRPYMFTASMTPATVASADAAFRLMSERPQAIRDLARNAEALYAGLARMGFELGPEPSPVVAVKCPDAPTAVALWNGLIDAGLYTNIAIPPATPNALSLLRVSISAAHESWQIARALDTLEAVGARLGLISGRERPSQELVAGSASAAPIAAPVGAEPRAAARGRASASIAPEPAGRPRPRPRGTAGRSVQGRAAGVARDLVPQIGGAAAVGEGGLS
ncbi:MAG: aminotransferase class I/II-fold pyridoxal phosphate-dependent enzyme [Pseudomonadota bacterium]